MFPGVAIRVASSWTSQSCRRSSPRRRRPGRKRKRRRSHFIPGSGIGNVRRPQIGRHPDGEGENRRKHGMPDRLLGPPGQCFPEDQTHPVMVERPAGGIAADVRLEGDDPIMGLENRDVAEDLGHLFDPVPAIRGRGMFEPLEHPADQTLQRDDIALVERDLKFIDLRIVGAFPSTWSLRLKISRWVIIPLQS